jgi:hypothetical protein
MLLCPAWFTVTYVREFLAVDATLDSGASWDYVAMKPDYSTNRPYIPFSKRHQGLSLAAGCCLVGAMMYSLTVFWKERSEHVA